MGLSESLRVTRAKWRRRDSWRRKDESTWKILFRPTHHPRHPYEEEDEEEEEEEEEEGEGGEIKHDKTKQNHR